MGLNFNQELLKLKVIILTDKINLLDFLKSQLKDYFCISFNSYSEDVTTCLKKEKFDLMFLDYDIISSNVHNIIEEIRSVDSDLYIFVFNSNTDSGLLKNFNKLDIQEYCDNITNLDNFNLHINFALKTIYKLYNLKKVNEELISSNNILEHSYLESIEVLRRTVEVKDLYTKGHSDRVAEYSLLIGQKLHLSDSDMKILKIGSLFHDIGKVGIPDAILLKEEKLTDNEYAIIKNHPSIGAHILSNAKIFEDIIPIVKYHHERYDGTGYPFGLSGNDIPYLARIVSVADTFDAMTSRRSYRDALDFEYTKNEITSCKGTQFDPDIADAFLDILTNEPEKILNIQERF